MFFTHDNTASMAWSLTAKDILLRGVSGTVVTFNVQLDGQDAATFNLIPIEGGITLSLRGLLEAILPKETGVDPMLSGLASRTGGHSVAISATDDLQNTASVTLTCFSGGIDESGDDRATRWLSWKPQVTTSYRWGRELLSLLLMPGYASSQVKVTIYYLYNSPEIVTLAAAPTVENSKPCIWVYDCSYATIAALASHSAEDTILAYDITMGALPRRRFILAPTDNRGREFIFRNSMGVLDTLFTAGDVESTGESDTATARNNNKETEVSNTFVTRQKVSTGLLQREREIANLLDFLRSNERYVLTPGDSAKRIIVDNIESDISFGQPSSASVTFHLADGFSGLYFEDENIEEYEFVSAE